MSNKEEQKELVFDGNKEINIKDVMDLDKCEIELGEEGNKKTIFIKVCPDTVLLGEYQVKKYLGEVIVQESEEFGNYSMKYAFDNTEEGIEKFIKFLNSKLGLNIKKKKNMYCVTVYTENYWIISEFSIENLITGKIIRDSLIVRDKKLREYLETHVITNLGELNEAIKRVFKGKDYNIEIRYREEEKRD